MLFTNQMSGVSLQSTVCAHATALASVVNGFWHLTIAVSTITNWRLWLRLLNNCHIRAMQWWHLQTSLFYF